MPDLDYGYNVSIQQNATSDPAHVPTNQWQKKDGGGNWANINGETGATYEVKEEDKAAKLRLVQTLGGAKAYSNELQVTSADPPALSSGYIGIRIKNGLRVKLNYDSPTAPINVYYKFNEGDPWEYYEQVPAGTNRAWQEDFNAYFALESSTMTGCGFKGSHINAEFELLEESDFTNCTDLSYLFADCRKFNQDLDWLKIPNATDISYMFWRCNSMMGSVGFETPNVRNMEGALQRLDISTSPWDPDLSTWDTSKVTNMGWMFYNLNQFNNDSITGWDTSKVTNMRGMFLDATNFNQNLRGWCVERIASEPSGGPQDSFSNGSALTSINKPLWGQPC